MTEKYQNFLRRYGTALGGLALFIFFAIAAENFLNPSNLLNVLKQISFLTILAIGFSFALTTSELDLSFATVGSLACVVAGGLIYHQFSPILAIAAGLFAGLAAGVINGLIVTRLKVPSLIGTLAVSSIATGVSFWITGGVAFVGRWADAFLFLGRGQLVGIPVLVFWTLIIAVFSLFVLKQTRIGIHMIFTGENDEAARLGGIPTQKMKVLGLSISGLTAGFTGVLLASTLSSADPTAADGFMLTAIAAVLLGMTMIEPGHPNVPGSLIGALTIGILSNGLILMGVEYYVQDIILGMIIIASVSVSASTITKAAFSV
ncbi:MAG: ABC transporter permease [Desulfobacterales bacterium]|nr:MAG: ABC transporter permease [Desulfobacterales bacterium]